MHPDDDSRFRPSRRSMAALALAFLLPAAATARGDWTTVAEMLEPEGVVVGTTAERDALAATREASEAVSRVEGVVTRDWSELRAVDWPALSRHQVEATAGWELPATPGPLVGRVLARDAAGLLHVEIRGPRLPSRFDIVFRYSYFFATYDPVTGEVDHLLATIRGWIEE